MPNKCEICGIPIYMFHFEPDYRREGIVWCNGCFEWIAQIIHVKLGVEYIPEVDR